MAKSAAAADKRKNSSDKAIVGSTDLTMAGAEILLKTLEDEGVEVIFGYPGGAVLPIYDALYDMMPFDKVDKKIISGEIEIAPLAFMRGRTLKNSYIIIDEAQNTTKVQMKMLLTRLGEGSKMVITGDLTQVDLPAGQISGLGHSINILKKIKGIEILKLDVSDIVRHPIVSKIIDAYEKN